MEDLSIERRLLSRCTRYAEDEDSIQAILNSRYSLKGDQKNYLSLNPAKSDYQVVKPEVLKKKDKVLQFADVGEEPPIPRYRTSQSGSENKYSKWKTRNEFKQFINSNLKLQRLARKNVSKAKASRSAQGNDLNIVNRKAFQKLLKIEDFTAINKLWKTYVNDFLGNDENTTLTTMGSKLSTAEFVGAFIEVEYSKCISNVGIQGIVIWESQFNFIIVTGRGKLHGWKGELKSVEAPSYSSTEEVGGLRVISKRNTRFLIRIPVPNDPENEYQVLLNGNRIQYRGYERANRKLKNHAVSDLI